jgi:flagellar protein FliO/FliZ
MRTLNHPVLSRSLQLPVATILWLLHSATQAAGHAAPSPIGMAGEVMGGGFLLQFFSGLGLVVLCILGLAWLMKRAGGLRSSAQGTLRVIDGIALSARERIVLIEVGNTQVLLGVAPGRVNSLHVLDEKIAGVAATQPAATGFSTRLREVMGREAKP